MKNPDKKTETQSEEIKPVEEVTPVEEVKPVEEPKAEPTENTEQSVEEAKTENVGARKSVKSFFSNKRNIAIVACAGAAVVALSLGLGLGLGLKKDEEKTAFSAPEGIEVVGSTISWTAVDDAVNGYTLKFAESDKEMSLTVVSYDLLSDKSYLKEGLNTLSVKVNETDVYLASQYSAEVTYTYSPAPPAKTAFMAPKNVKVEDDTLKWDKVDGAESYTVKIGDDTTTTVKTNSLDLTTVTDKLEKGENTLSVKVNATDNKLESPYSTTATYTYNPVKPQFPVPANVKVEGDTLKWDADDEADNGYIVKINTDETTVVETATLDLTTVTAKLSSGENTLSVKVKETDAKLESEYSAEVTYTYTPNVDEEVADYVALVDAINEVSDEDADYAANVKAALDAASNKYSGLSSDAKAHQDVITAKALYDTYEESYNTAKEAYESFAAELEAATDEAEKEEDISLLTSKTATATSSYGELNTLACSMITSEQNTAYTNLPTLIEEWQTNIDAAKEAMGVTFPELTSDAVAEANIVKADALLETYAEYKAYVKKEITEEHEAVTEALSAAKTKIENTVNPIKTAVNGFTGDVATIAAKKTTDADKLTYYGELSDYQDAVKAFGAYASSLWSDELTDKIGSEIAALCQIPKTNGELCDVLVTGGTQGNVTVVYEAYNILDNLIAYSEGNIPALEVTVNGTTVSGCALTVNKKGKYSYTTEWQAASTGKVLTVSYTAGGKSGSVEYTELNDNGAYFADKAIDENAIKLIRAESAFFDIYLADEISYGATAASLPEVYGVPLISGVPVNNGMTVEKFRRHLAQNYNWLIKDWTNPENTPYEVRFVVYNKTGEERNSLIDSARVSHDTYVLDITETDAKTAILVNSVIDDGVAADTGIFTLVTEANISADFLAQFDNEAISKDNIADYLQVKVAAYATTDTTGENPLFSAVAPFRAGSYNYNTFIREWANYRLQNEIAPGTVNFYLTLSIVPKDSNLENSFRESERINVKTGGLYTGSHTFKNGDEKSAILPSSGLVDGGISAEGVFTLITEANISDAFVAQFENSDITKANIKDYLQIRISAYAETDAEATDELFYAIAPFKAGGYNYNAFIKDWTVYRYPDGVQSETVNFYFMYTIQLKEEVNGSPNPLLPSFKDSERIKVDNASGPYTGAHTFDYVQITLHNIIDAGVWNGGNFSLIQAYNEGHTAIYDNFLGQFNNVIDGLTLTKDNAANYLQIRISAYDETDTEGTNELFYVTAPFENVGYNYNTFTKNWSVYHYKNAENKNETVNFYLTLTVQLKEKVNDVDNPLSKYFKDSERTNVRKENDYKGSYEFKESDVVVPSGSQVWFSANDWLIFARTKGQMPNAPEDMPKTGNESGNGNIFSNGVTCIEIKFEKGEVSKSAYLFRGKDSEFGGLYLYTDKEGTQGKLYCNPVADGGISIDVDGGFNDWVEANYSLTDFDAKDGWAFSSKIYHDGNFYVGEGAYSTPITYAETRA